MTNLLRNELEFAGKYLFLLRVGGLIVSYSHRWALIRYFVISLPLVTIVSVIEHLDR
jgi:hypothetical protein